MVCPKCMGWMSELPVTVKDVKQLKCRSCGYTEELKKIKVAVEQTKQEKKKNGN